MFNRIMNSKQMKEFGRTRVEFSLSSQYRLSIDSFNDTNKKE